MLFLRDTSKTHLKTLRKFEVKMVKKKYQANINKKKAESNKWSLIQKVLL